MDENFGGMVPTHFLQINTEPMALTTMALPPHMATFPLVLTDFSSHLHPLQSGASLSFSKESPKFPPYEDVRSLLGGIHLRTEEREATDHGLTQQPQIKWTAPDLFFLFEV